MIESPKLFMLLLGCKPNDRNTEQHDIFFGIGSELRDLREDIFNFWPAAKKKIHVDAWREVTNVDGYKVEVLGSEAHARVEIDEPRLFFINLGGYKESEFEEFHYRFLVAATSKDKAIQQSRRTAFYIHTGFKDAPSHIDEKYGVDVDDVYEIADILPASLKQAYSLRVTTATSNTPDKFNLGYTRLEKL